MNEKSDTASAVSVIAMALQALLPIVDKAIEYRNKGVEVPGLADVEASLQRLRDTPDLPEKGTGQ